MKYEFVLTDKMKEDRFMCGKDDGICKECSCRMSEDDCVFNHLYVTAEQEYDIEEDFDSETRTVRYTVEQKQIDEIKVGDEIDHQGLRSVVLSISDECIYTLSRVGTTPTYKKCNPNIKKTGRNFPQIAEVLEQMKEGC